MLEEENWRKKQIRFSECHKFIQARYCSKPDYNSRQEDIEKEQILLK
jgi:hypothetical protein